MRLLQWAALRRDREQFIYNWMLEDDLKPSGQEEKRTNQGHCYANQVVSGFTQTKGIVMQTKS